MIRIPPQRGGWLEVICGPMFSGKSEEMIRRLRRAEIAGQRVVIFKPQIDDRYDATDVVSHAGARMRAVPVTSRAEIAARAQRLRRRRHRRGAVPRRAIVVRGARARATAATRVIVAGLDQDFRAPSVRPDAGAPLARRVRGQAAGRLPPLRRAGDDDAAARGRQPAPYSGETVVVGAAEQYEARCRDCHEPGVGAALVAA